ncbi:2-polyprenyl-6-methoxyphenol hydroxylase-like FAD-dependent oxidoreductase [Actinopolyspora lacussalsi]|nr:2-polyprenyl-6-methoxyphenol hydroxylase-like FAD-dependent oxidoreductase [Actinopolyspora lacussalsi]
MRNSDDEVLIVGAGPTGLLAGCELLRRGIEVRLVDRSPHPTDVPKALSVWPRVMDILTELGTGDQVRGVSVPVRAFRYFSERAPVASMSFTEELAARQLPQYETERILTERLRQLGGTVEREVRLLALENSEPATDDPGGTVTAILESADGSVHRSSAHYVIGADGAGSTVRGQLGVGFEGNTYPMSFALIDSHVDGRLPPDEISYYQSTGGTLVVVPQPGGVFRFLSVLPEGSEMTRSRMQSVIDTQGPRGVSITDPVWETVFRVHARRAGEFRRGRVFLAGDAAHVHSPAGGQGMNNGLQDAHNIAWKIAAVLRGDSPSTLLSTYDTERKEATTRIVRDTDLHTRALTARTRGKAVVRDTALRLLGRSGIASRFIAPVLAGVRLTYTPNRYTQRPSGPSCRTDAGTRLRGRPGAAVPRHVRQALGVAESAADPRGWTLLVRPPENDPSWTTELHRMTERLPRLTVLGPDESGSGASGMCVRAGYHLIRPDGHIAAHGHTDDLDSLRSELDLVFEHAATPNPV